MTEPKGVIVILPDGPPVLSPRSAGLLWEILLDARDRREYPSVPHCTIRALDPYEEAAEG